jgi:DNA-binding NtrC family response regulator
VFEAATARTACELFARHASEIDLLLSDIVMPGMNGPEMSQRLVGVRPQLKILFMSGYADVTSPLDDSNPQIGFLSKPFQASDLVAKVQEVLSRPIGAR